MLIRLVPLACAALLAFSPVALAQPPHRTGFWGEIGGGPARIRVSCTGCDDVTRRPGSGGYVRIGGTVSDEVLLGVESFTFTDDAFGFDDDDDPVRAENASLAAVALWFPGRSGFFLKGGVGPAYGDFTVDPEADPPLRARGTGIGLTIGVGYDFRVGRRFAVTVGAGGWVTAIGDIVLPARTVDDVIATLYSATIGLTLR